MKKVLFSFLVLLLLSCSGENNYKIPFNENTVKTIETDEYIITEKYDFTNGLGMIYWKFVSIQKKSDIKKEQKDSLNINR